jgi:glycosyltransferase involved in cell wall biosynthesis
MLNQKNTYLLFGGTLEAFINFRLHLIAHIIEQDKTASIICVYFGNIEKRSIPTDFKNNVEWVSLNGSHIGSILYDIFPLFKFIRLIIAKKPTRIVSFNGKSIFYTGILKSLYIIRADVTALLEGLGLGFESLTKTTRHAKFRNAIFKLAFRSINKWIFLNRHDLELFEKKNLKKKTTPHICINGIGIDMRKFSLSLTATEIWKNHSVGFCGRFIKEKGIYIVAETAKLVKLKLPEIHFSLAGRTVANVNKIDLEAVEGWLSNNLINSINFYPNISDFYKQQSIILLPTTYNEGLPAIAMECQSLGIPILMNNIPQLQKAIPKELSFHLNDHNDPKIYADIIINYFKSFEAFSNASKLSKAFAREEFDAHYINQRIFNFISN